MRVVRWWAVFSLLAAVVLVAGCGKSEPKRYRVTGSIKFKGQPVKLGTISFRSLDGTSTGAGAIVNGEYDIPEKSGLPAGKYVVAVFYPDPKAPLPKPDEPPGDSDVARDILPPKYNSKSELTAEVKEEPRNEINFDLK